MARLFRAQLVARGVLLACAASMTACVLGTSARVAAPASQTSGQGAATRVPVVGNRAEWDEPTDILVHTPGDEIFLGVVHPLAALFARPFSIRGARREHERFIEALGARGARVHTMVSALLSGTLDVQDNAVPGPDLDELRDFAGRFLRYDTSALPAPAQAAQAAYREDTLARLHPRELVEVLLKQPTIHLTPGGSPAVRLSASYSLEPVMNLYFTRDQMITTARGVVLGRMGAEPRRREVEIARLVLRKLGVEPIYEVEGEGRLEGGDFLPAGDTAFLAEGLRTNAEAARQLLRQKVFGAARVVVVKDPWKDQSQVHLDTYFNLLADKLAVLVSERMDIRDAEGRVVESAHPDRRLRADVYELRGGEYVRIAEDTDFQRYLERSLGFTIIPVTPSDQRQYGINFLTVAPRRILAGLGVSAAYDATLAQHGVAVTWLDLGELAGGWGAAHCMTQVLHRQP